MSDPLLGWVPDSFRWEKLEWWARHELGVDLRKAYEVSIKPESHIEIIWYEPRRKGVGDYTNVKRSKLIPIGSNLAADRIGGYTDQLQLLPE